MAGAALLSLRLAVILRAPVARRPLAGTGVWTPPLRLRGVARRLRAHRARPRPRRDVADAREAIAHRPEREVAGLDVRDLVPAERRRDASVLDGPHPVGGRDGPVERVLAVVDEDAWAARHLPLRRRDRGHELDDRLRDRAGDLAHERELELAHDRHEDVEPRRAARLGKARDAELVEHLFAGERDLADVRPGVAFRRIEVDEQVVRLRHRVDARVPGVQLDAAEVRDPGEAGGVGDHGEVRLVPARVADVDGLEPFGVGVWDALL